MSARIQIRDAAAAAFVAVARAIGRQFSIDRLNQSHSSVWGIEVSRTKSYDSLEIHQGRREILVVDIPIQPSPTSAFPFTGLVSPGDSLLILGVGSYRIIKVESDSLRAIFRLTCQDEMPPTNL